MTATLLGSIMSAIFAASPLLVTAGLILLGIGLFAKFIQKVLGTKKSTDDLLRDAMMAEFLRQKVGAR